MDHPEGNKKVNTKPARVIHPTELFSCANITHFLPCYPVFVIIQSFPSHLRLWVVAFLLVFSAVDHKHHVVDRDGGFRDVRSNDNLNHYPGVVGVRRRSDCD